MSIISSVVAIDAPQQDGRRSIQEIHTDHLGGKYEVWYMAPDMLWDAAAALSARVASIVASISEREISRNVNSIVENGSLAVLTFNHSTAADARTALRQTYRSALRVEAIMIGDFLGTLTDAQLRSLLGMTQSEVTTFRAAKLQPAADAAAKIRAEAGV